MPDMLSVQLQLFCYKSHIHSFVHSFNSSITHHNIVQHRTGLVSFFFSLNCHFLSICSKPIYIFFTFPALFCQLVSLQKVCVMIMMEHIFGIGAITLPPLVLKMEPYNTCPEPFEYRHKNNFLLSLISQIIKLKLRRGTQLN